MERENASQLCRSCSLPARSPAAIATESSWTTSRPPPPIPAEPPSSITRPYRISSPSSSSSSLKGFFPSSARPSALLQRRANANQGLSEVKAAPVEGDPPPSPSPSPSPPPPLPSISSTSPSAYEVLQVSPTASQQEIKASYWRLARQHHPDKVPSDRKETSAVLFLRIHAAYLALKDPEARAQYDHHQMALQSAQSSSAALKTPRFCRPSPNVFTPRNQPYTPKGATAMPNSYTPWSQPYTPRDATAIPNSYTPRSQYYMTPKGATVGSAPSNVSTPRTPFSAGRSWETDQCW